MASSTRAESGLGAGGGLMGKARLSLDQSVAVVANIRTLRLARGSRRCRNGARSE